MPASPSRAGSSPSRLPMPSPSRSSPSGISKSPGSARTTTYRTPNNSSGGRSDLPSPPTTLWPSSSGPAPDGSPKIKSTSQEGTKPQQRMGNSNPRYLGPAHMGEPCTIGSLDHKLNCGHKVITMQPEACADNCHFPESNQANPRSLNEPFVCFACITKDLQQKHAEKIVSFRSELEEVAKATQRSNAFDWIRSKLEIVELAWTDLEVDDMMKQSKHGRFCHAMYVDPDYYELVSKAMKKRERSGRLLHSKPEPAVPKETSKRTSKRGSDQKTRDAKKKSKLPRRSPQSSPSQAWSSTSERLSSGK